jgi:hypothetical protein
MVAMDPLNTAAKTHVSKNYKNGHTRLFKIFISQADSEYLTMQFAPITTKTPKIYLLCNRAA